MPLIWPLLRARAGSTAAPAQAVYRDQLAELDQDLARNAISAEDAAAARAEISRRLLAASTSETPLPERAASPVMAALVAALVIAGGAAGYLVLGAPFSQVQPPPPDEASHPHGDRSGQRRWLDAARPRLADAGRDR
ncbi:MAG: c-type cytochrome biogenesis protein CcmI [Alphaproteobacteria bacterium]|nr:c-type cytochrome biogenesis protein CcmI [Alphaproteobacteria bacterium]